MHNIFFLNCSIKIQITNRIFWFLEVPIVISRMQPVGNGFTLSNGTNKKRDFLPFGN